MDNKVPQNGTPLPEYNTVGGANCTCYLCKRADEMRVKRNVEFAYIKPKPVLLERATIEQLKDELRKREKEVFAINCTHCGSWFKYEMTEKEARSINLHISGGQVQHCFNCHSKLAVVIPGTQIV
jgi:hypothetical protein